MGSKAKKRSDSTRTRLIFEKLDEKLNLSNKRNTKLIYIKPTHTGLEGYSREPRFDQKRCGSQENAKYLDGIRDLTAPREGGFTKTVRYGMRFFFFACLSFVKTEKLIVAQKSINFLQKLLSACFR